MKLREGYLEGLQALVAKLPPPPSPAEVRKIRERHAGNIIPCTVCECGWQEFYHRMGCRHNKSFGNNAGHQVQWLFAAQDGALEGSGSRIIKHGDDFCFIGDNDAGSILAGSGLGDPASGEVGKQ